ncbi:uncharacterized protein L201_007651 [Kwoniella dendrophila CBS 6074]|uniref:Uncharacterized protein n=1 Tax=Kwoniella dendrophila CBS 6074 TaxID=1295534 RepID=A0AAX4K552_9TREE
MSQSNSNLTKSIEPTQSDFDNCHRRIQQDFSLLDGDETSLEAVSNAFEFLQDTRNASEIRAKQRWLSKVAEGKIPSFKDHRPSEVQTLFTSRFFGFFNAANTRCTAVTQEDLKELEDKVWKYEHIDRVGEILQTINLSNPDATPYEKTFQDLQSRNSQELHNLRASQSGQQHSLTQMKLPEGHHDWAYNDDGSRVNQ